MWAFLAGISVHNVTTRSNMTTTIDSRAPLLNVRRWQAGRGFSSPVTV